MDASAKVLVIEFALNTYERTIEAIDNNESRPQEDKALALKIFLDTVKATIKS